MQGEWHSETGDWKKYTDDGETESQCSALALPQYGSSSAAAAASSGEHASGSGQSRPRCQECFGKAGCPYCFLKVPLELHHKLSEVGTAIYTMKLALEFSCPDHPDELKGIMLALYLTAVAACVKHSELAHPGSEEVEKGKKSLRSLGLLAQEGGTMIGAMAGPPWGGWIPGPPPVGSATYDEHSASGSGKKKKAKKWDWDEPITAEWRQEPKVPHNVARMRGVKVRVDGPDKWQYLDGAILQAVLSFYDRAQLLEELLDVETVKDRSYDIRFEGGEFMTQRSTKHGTRREMNVVYVPAVTQQ
jgi:hypothetical protein